MIEEMVLSNITRFDITTMYLMAKIQTSRKTDNRILIQISIKSNLTSNQDIPTATKYHLINTI